MGTYKRLEVNNAIIEGGLMPLFYTGDEVLAPYVMEITNRKDRAFQVFQAEIDAVKNLDLPIIVGIGSIIKPVTISIFNNLGANFVVGPINNLLW